MDERYGLISQIENLITQLLMVEQAVQSQSLDPYLRARVGARFDKLLARKQSTATKLRRSVLDSQPPKELWEAFERLEMECLELFEECLAFIQGALARADGVDDGMCLLADHLLDDLASWADVGFRRFTILGTGEIYRDTAEIIRIRFPECSIWGLPTVAHELGHYVGTELRENVNGEIKYPFQEMLREADERRPDNWPLPHSRYWHHLQELFADLFATHCLGPAFASCFIMLRLKPVGASQDSLTHPSYAKRAHAIFWLLEKMDRTGGELQQPYRAIINILRELWRTSLRDTDQPADLPDAERALLESQLGDLYGLLIRTTPTRLAYQLGDWHRAQGLTARLLSDSWSGGEYSDENNGTRRDVLNAAWLGRLQLAHSNKYRLDVNEVGNRALELYRSVPPRQY